MRSINWSASKTCFRFDHNSYTLHDVPSCFAIHETCPTDAFVLSSHSPLRKVMLTINDSKGLWHLRYWAFCEIRCIFMLFLINYYWSAGMVFPKWFWWMLRSCFFSKSCILWESWVIWVISWPLNTCRESFTSSFKLVTNPYFFSLFSPMFVKNGSLQTQPGASQTS